MPPSLLSSSRKSEFCRSIRAGSMSGLAEEVPTAYKDVSRVVEVVHQAGIAKKIARLEPIAVIKG